MRFRFPKKFRVVVLLVGSVFALNVFAASDGSSNGSGESAKDELRVGLIFAMTGPAAPFGIPEHHGTKHLIDRMNKHGGINGHKIVAFFEDGESNPTVTAKVARELILQHNVDVIIGPTTGTGALAIGPLVARHKIPLLAPVGTASITDKGTDFYDWVFRVAVSDKDSVPMALDYMKKKGYERLAVFFQQDAYGKAGINQFRKLTSRPASSINIVATASAPMTAASLSVQATKLLAANPDVIMIQASSVVAGAALLRALNQRDSNVPIVAPVGMSSRTLLNAVENHAAEGVVAIDSVGWDKPTSQQAKFIKSYGKAPESFGEAAATAVLILKGAATNIEGEITGPRLRDTIEHLCPFPTLFGSTGCYSPENHDGNIYGVTKKVINGEWVTIGKPFKKDG